jgi:hypothetical protein
VLGVIGISVAVKVVVASELEGLFATCVRELAPVLVDSVIVGRIALLVKVVG